MQLDALCKIVDTMADGAPDEVADAMEGVEVVCVEGMEDARLEIQRPDLKPVMDDLKEQGDADPYTLPDDLKGCFIGAPLEKAEDAEDGKETDASDQGDDLMPEGILLLVASNIENDDEARSVMTHEVGHALGLDEQTVDAIGLNEPAKPEGEATTEGEQKSDVPPAATTDS